MQIGATHVISYDVAFAPDDLEALIEACERSPTVKVLMVTHPWLAVPQKKRSQNETSTGKVKHLNVHNHLRSFTLAEWPKDDPGTFIVFVVRRSLNV